MPRFNPRQRYNGDRTCTTAGVPLEFWMALIELAWSTINQPIVRSSQEEILRYADDDANYKNGLTVFTTQLQAGITAIQMGAEGWVEYPLLKVRRGRGDEVTVVSKVLSGPDGAEIGPFLTNASLGWYDRHPNGNTNPAFGPISEEVAPSAFMTKVRKLMQMLEKSADRREDYTYRDRPISELRARYDHKFTLGRRREAIESTIARRKSNDELFTRLGWKHPRIGRFALLDYKVAKALEAA